MTNDELILLVERIKRAEFSSEEELDSAIDLLERNVPDPAVTDLIYHSDFELTAEQIVLKALSYKPLITPSK